MSDPEEFAAQAMQSLRHVLPELMFDNPGLSSQDAAALLVLQAFELLIEVTSTDADPVELVGETAVQLYVRASAVQAAAAGQERAA